ncbi:hypothetical protein AK812_SmicGene46487, partial [Symbiodinium microadriaticum]
CFLLQLLRGSRPTLPGRGPALHQQLRRPLCHHGVSNRRPHALHSGEAGL